MTDDLGKLFILIGFLFLLIGIAWSIGGKFLNFDKLPGDINIDKGNFKFYFPLGTSILLSIILSLLIWIFINLRK